jgi:UPF0755 protein
MKSKKKFIFVAFIAVVAAAGFAFYQQARNWLASPIESLTAPTLYEVAQGASLNGVLRDLEKRGFMKHPRELSWWLRLTRPDYQLKAGEYELTPGLTPVALIDLLDSGKVVLHKLTILEGTTVKEMRELIANEPLIKPTTRTLSGSELMKKLGSENPHPEGWFFPDTQTFTKGSTDLDFLRTAHERMKTELERAWANRDPALPLANSYEALILASIVEKETGLASERAQIAGVFVSRLRKGMRLETDPTIIYGLGDQYNGDIRTADLRHDNPYNTRTRAGLPPTPICLPSLASLQAALHPDITGALFFVATGSGDGSTYFSKTYEEHQEAVKRYLKRTRRR